MKELQLLKKKSKSKNRKKKKEIKKKELFVKEGKIENPNL